ncbi:hypothetical protein HELRODRAFT_158472 [Helobdella robusta]|uniref:Uncharacterized protein n=1 Tax=Helobdella robusta TaxID=6412 RepID=T1EMU2_HELRO|nr:hypothetical protein HELRODRAFT_158472 [Helobdella robusta]ESO12064.1 hypothetical protein HELRODRAFT_158472 [Helobdella robusta]
MWECCGLNYEKRLKNLVPQTNYEERLKNLVPHTLRHRRLRGYIIMACKLTRNPHLTTSAKKELEENLDRPLQWLVCLLHCNELPFRRFLAGLDYARTTGPSTSTGTISSALEYDPNELPIVNYLPITGKVTDCDEAVKKDLSTDQLYFYTNIGYLCSLSSQSWDL